MARVEPWISISKLGLEEQFQNGSWFKRQIVSLRCHFIWDISKSSPFQFSIPARSSSVRSHWGPFRTSAKLISHFCETGFPTFANISTTNPNYRQAIEICGIQYQYKYKYNNSTNISRANSFKFNDKQNTGMCKICLKQSRECLNFSLLSNLLGIMIILIKMGNLSERVGERDVARHILLINSLFN